ncbi:ATP-dependent helicase, partial [Prosthecobacter sp.]|uniref:ATP-dependent helicase n=1 Tax=Prosthecobacter sp. TaxID=1965333 RepID=UPI0037CC6576
HTANSLIKNNVGRRPKSLWSRNHGSDLVRLIANEDDKEEADMIAKEVETAHFANKQPLEDFAVLFRTNDQSRVLEQAFRQRKIAYRVVGARSFFDRREVKDIVSYLSVLHNPHDDMALLRILNTPTRGIGSATAELARERSMEKHHSIWVALCDEEFLRQIPEKGRNAIRLFTALIVKYSGPASTPGTNLVDMTQALILETGYMEHLKKAAKEPEDFAGWENGINELYKSMTSHAERDRASGLAGFLDEVSLNDEREEKDDIEKKKGVCLITMHASKGLEFPVVFLPGMEQGILPHKRSFDEGRVDEERRLFYVGITRAKQKLTLSHTRTRMKWGKKQSNMPSTFLKELDRKYVEELDYTKHMNETTTQEENTNFFSGLRAMMAEK